VNNLKFFICAVGETIVGLFRNSRRNVVEMSTSEFLDVYSRMTTPWFCFVVRNYVREGDRWWHLSKLNIYADDRYWQMSTLIVHSAFRDAYPEVFLHRMPTREGTVYSWLNRKNETVDKFLGHGLVLERTTFRIELLKMLISEYGDRKLCFNIRGVQ
jgi:hypothetical protein